MRRYRVTMQVFLDVPDGIPPDTLRRRVLDRMQLKLMTDPMLTYEEVLLVPDEDKPPEGNRSEPR